MADKNLISVKQLRQDELQQFVLTYAPISSGSGISSGIFSGSSFVSGFSLPISSGVSQIAISYSGHNPVIGQIGSSGASDPIIGSMLYSSTPTGSILGLTATTHSSNYYVNILFSV